MAAFWCLSSPLISAGYVIFWTPTQILMVTSNHTLHVNPPPSNMLPIQFMQYIHLGTPVSDLLLETGLYPVYFFIPAQLPSSMPPTQFTCISKGIFKSISNSIFWFGLVWQYFIAYKPLCVI